MHLIYLHCRDHVIIKSLFESLQHLGSAPYSALITGMLKAGAKSEGDRLVEEAKEKKIKLSVHAYNAIILRRISIYDKVDVKIEAILVGYVSFFYFFSL